MRDRSLSLRKTRPDVTDITADPLRATYKGCREVLHDTHRAEHPLTLKNILFLSDFSESSEAALPFAIAMARNYGASVHALHVLTPTIPAACREAIQADEDLAATEMAKVASQLAGVAHNTAVVSGSTLWSALEPAIKERDIDLIVVGTHGRTGVSKLLLGSFAEEIFRRSSVPVVTIGPDVRQDMHPSGRFRSVLFATDFSKSSAAAAVFAVSLAEENDAQLLLEVIS